jgi:hypothetical protein
VFALSVTQLSCGGDAPTIPQHTPPSLTHPIFQTWHAFAAGSGPVSLCTADFVGDLMPDIATANLSGNSVSILSNDGRGMFSLEGKLSAGIREPAAVCAADLDADGDQDLAAANGLGDITVMLRDGSWGFRARNYDVEGEPVSICASDFDSDGVADLAVAGSNTNDVSEVSVLLNDGEGGFGTTLRYPVGTEPFSVISADLNGDDNADVVLVGKSPRVAVLIGIGNGTFRQPAQVNQLPDAAWTAATAVDVYRDGKIDLAVVGDDDDVLILHNKGDGTFWDPVSYPVGHPSLCAAGADLDGDLFPELVLAGSLTIPGNAPLSKLSVLKNYFGTFLPAVAYTANNHPLSISARDVDSDGDPDILLVNPAAGAVSVFVNDGNGGLPETTGYPVGGYPSEVVTADLNGDGSPDAAVAAHGTDVAVLLNAGDGTFGAAADYLAGSGPVSIVAADLDRDGDRDLATANTSSNQMAVLLNDGDGTFQRDSLYSVGTGPSSVSTADIDGDGNTDIIVGNRFSQNVSVLTNRGDGTFWPRLDYRLAAGADDVTATDLDGDGAPDLAVAVGISGLSVLLNEDGAFSSETNYARSHCLAVFAADLNGDGYPDIVTSNVSSASLTVFLNSGAGGFPAAVQYPAGVFDGRPRVADLNGDGYPDVMVPTDYANTVAVLLGNGDGTLQAVFHYGVGDSPESISPADLDGDGWPDLAVLNSQSGDLKVLLNRAEP